jgi:hypothetical protein
MSRQSVIERNVQNLEGRNFRFVRHFHRKRRKFKCFVCQGTGYNGHILEDYRGSIRVGENCLRENFLITLR